MGASLRTRVTADPRNDCAIAPRRYPVHPRPRRVQLPARRASHNDGAMAERWLNGRVEISRGDITRLEVDAIVNAANESLLGGGGVDGAIHRAAGPGLLEECRNLGGARTGEARITRGYRLPARHVIHAVGPVWRGGEGGEDELLASCYRESLARAAELQLASVAFPAISTGIFGFPIDRATRIAMAEIREGLARHPGIRRVILCCFSEADLELYRRLAPELLGA